MFQKLFTRRRAVAVATVALGLSGMSLSIARLWIMMYGRMPADFSTRLEAIRDVDLLDKMYDALINDDGADAVFALLPVLPVASAPAESAPAEPAPAAPAATAEPAADAS